MQAYQTLYALLSPETIAKACGAQVAEVVGWIRREGSIEIEELERLNELNNLVLRMSKLVKPEFIEPWLLGEVPALDHRVPVEVIAQGESLEVARLISSLESPTFS